MIPEELADLVKAGLSDREIAARLGVSARTVLRWRKRRGLPSLWTPNLPEHGTRARYRRGCICDDCRAANARAHFREVEVYKVVSRRTDTRSHARWTAEDDAIVLDTSLTLLQRAQRLQRSYDACTTRLIVLRRQERVTA